MRLIWQVFAALIITAGTAVGPAAMAQPSGPAEVMDAYTAAINAGDVEAALALVADDAVYDRPTGVFTGKEAVRAFVASLIDRHAVVELIGERTVDGTRVSWHSRVTIDDPNNPGGPRLVLMNDSASDVVDGLIVMHMARPATPGPAEERGTPDEAQALAEAAAAYLEQYGAAVAFPAFSTGEAWHDRDLYVFVFDRDRISVAHGGDVGLIGQDLTDLADPDGVLFVQQFVAVEDRGWVDYHWIDPLTNAYRAKSSYIIRVGDFVVGVGAYVP